MSSLNHPVFYACLMVVAGIGIPIMAAMNAGLGGKINNPALATVILLSVGLLFSITVFLISPSETTSPVFTLSTPIYYYFAGLLFVFYISTITWVAPKFGIGNAVAFVLLGQLISMAVIDHFTLFNAISYPITWRRVIGLILMMTGIYLVVKKNG